jgi:hypothetical protein
MVAPQSDARLVHAVRGRLRVRLEDGAPTGLLDGLGPLRVAPGVQAVEVRSTARSVVVRYDHAEISEIAVLEAFADAGIDVISASDHTEAARSDATQESSPSDARSGPDGSSSLRELLIGPPPKLDRRFAESLALSAVSLVGARQIGLAFGGGMTLPAYFVIWLTLRRLTGAGRRRA